MKKVLSLTTLMAGAMMVFNAAAADAPKELNLGILGGQNATQQIGDNQCVKQFLDKELNVDTKLRNSSDYSGVIQGLLGGKIDLVLSMSPSSFASVYIKDPKAVDIVGIAVDDVDQSRGYHSVVVVKAGSPYQKLEDLKGKAIGFADPDSTSGFLIPNQAFKKLFGGTVDNKYNNTFSSVTFSGGHEQDILAERPVRGRGDLGVDDRRLQHRLHQRRVHPHDPHGSPGPDETDPHHLAVAADPERPDPGEQLAAGRL